MSTSVYPVPLSGIQETLLAAKGDLISATANDTPAILSVGSNDQVLTADSSTATGLKWAAAAGGGSNFSLLNSGNTDVSGSSTKTISGISGVDKVLIIVDYVRLGAAGYVWIRYNTDTSTSNYTDAGQRNLGPDSYDNSNSQGIIHTNLGYFRLGYVPSSASGAYGTVLLTGANSTGLKYISLDGGANNDGGTHGQGQFSTQGLYKGTSTISSVSIINSSGGNFSSGNVYVYTSA